MTIGVRRDLGDRRDGLPQPSPEQQLLSVLREANGRPIDGGALASAGIADPARAMYELERAGHRICRSYEELGSGRRRFRGYRLATT